MNNGLVHRGTLPDAGRRRGVALVVVLALVVLVTGIVIAFFSRSIADSQIAGSSANAAKADLFLRGTVDSIIGDLKQEMAAGSRVVGTNFYPLSSVTVPPFTPASLPANVVARSAGGVALYDGTPYTPAATLRASSSHTDTLSINGRNISAARWNKPLFLTPTSDTDLTPPGFTVPDWIYVSRNGSNPVTYSTAVTNKTSDLYVAGRYAYILYNEGALLDMNAAGYPNDGSSSPSTGVSTPGHGLTAEQVARKGSLALADLRAFVDPTTLHAATPTPLLTAAQINTLIAWRNNASLLSNNIGGPKLGMTPTSPGFYDVMTGKGFTVNDPVGFMTIPARNMSRDGAQTDHLFTNRQELIKMLVQGLTKQSPLSPTRPSREIRMLQQISMFSRETNAPAITANGAGVLVQKSFTRSDGTIALIGEPLLKHRFPLNRLGWFGDPAAHAADILANFSLQQRTDGTWGYVNPDNLAAGPVIGVPVLATLDQVSAAGREPNYFELLNAAIMQNSLGIGHKKQAFFQTQQDASAVRQVFEIGLCLIDQYDADDDPTVLTLGPPGTPVTVDITNTLPIAGVESLPYPFMVGLQSVLDSSRQGGKREDNSPLYYYDGYQQFVLWNPHKNAAASGGQFRIRANGETYLYLYDQATGRGYSSDPHTMIDECIYFNTNTKSFSPMTPLTPSDADLAQSAVVDRFPVGVNAPATAVGFFVGELRAPAVASKVMRHSYNQPLTYSFEKLDSRGHWLPYCTLPRLERTVDDDGTHSGDDLASLNGGTYYSAISYVHSDPRTIRFGMGSGTSEEAAKYQNAFVPQDLISPANDFIQAGSVDDNSPGGPNPPPFSDYKLTSPSLAFNTDFRYYDYLDASHRPVYRVADGNANIDFHSGSPYTFGDANPVTLNRPFSSVGEMGFAFRGDPWRTLNFYNKDTAGSSPDSALLDYFTTNETSGVRAGVVDVNNASVSTLTALLAGAYHKPPGGSSSFYLDYPASYAIATKINAYLNPATGPRRFLQNKGELAGMIDTLIVSNNLAANLKVDLKINREMIVRALAPVINTRTWNLMLDVVAQTGRCPAFSGVGGSLDKFIVEGERRVWVHLAIDRFTGKVVDERMEYVNE